MTTNREVAERWVFANHDLDLVNGDEHSARSSNRNFWFRGASLYSYQTEIARFVTAPTGEQWVLMDSHSYSMTTSSKHYPACRGAVFREDIRSVCLDFGGIGVAQAFDNNQLNVLLITEKLIDAAETAQTKAIRSKKYASIWIEVRDRIMDQVRFLRDAHLK